MESSVKSGFYANIAPKLKNLDKYMKLDPTNPNHSAFIHDCSNMLKGKIMDYGEGIVTYQLIKGELLLVSEETNQIPLMAQENVVSIWMDNEIANAGRKEDDKLTTLSHIKNREAFKYSLMETSQTGELTFIFLVSFLLTIVLVSFSIILYVFSKNFIDTSFNDLLSLEKTYQLLSDIHYTIYNTRELTLLDQNLTQSYLMLSLSKAYYYNQLQNDLENFEGVISEQEVNLSSQIFSETNSPESNSLFNTESLPFATYITNIDQTNGTELTYYFNFPELILSFCSNLFGVASNTNQTSNYFSYSIFHNGFNSVTNAIKELAFVFYEMLVLDCSTNMQTILAIFILAICLCIAFMPLALVLISFNNDFRRKILSLFLELSPKTVKALNAQCDQFLHNQLIGCEIDFDTVGEDILLNNDNDDAIFGSISRRTRKFTNLPNFMRNLTLILTFINTAVSVYFGMNYYLEKNYRDRISQMIDQFNLVIQIEPYSQLALNYQRECYYGDANITIDGKDKCSQSVDILSQADKITKILEELTQKALLSDSNVQNSIFQILQNDLCTNPLRIIDSSNNYLNCEQFAGSVITSVTLKINLI